MTWINVNCMWPFVYKTVLLTNVWLSVDMSSFLKFMKFQYSNLQDGGICLPYLIQSHFICENYFASGIFGLLTMLNQIHSEDNRIPVNILMFWIVWFILIEDWLNMKLYEIVCIIFYQTYYNDPFKSIIFWQKSI